MHARFPALALALTIAGPAPAAPRDAAIPRYAHVIVIVDENKDAAQILDPQAAPNLAGLASAYGVATRFYAEAHPSEPNYVALLAGDTFGLHDDDAYFCGPASPASPQCRGAGAPGYVDHTVRAPHIGDQLAAGGLSWKGYYESLPEPGSLAVTAGDPHFSDGSRKTALYASKHSGFMNFADVQSDPKRAERIVGFERLYADLDANALPAFALAVPNQCDDMHGLSGPNVPADCASGNTAGLIARGDAFAGALVKRIEASPAWRSTANMAIVITFDEGAGKSREGCCSVTPEAPSNFGGGHIPTIVITNHGPRGLADDTPYNHYSLLRTLEDGFGIGEHLSRAADEAHSVVAMAPLFAAARR